MADIAGQLRAEQANVGNELPFADSLIAATAMFLQRPLLTMNLRDFERIPGLTVIPFHLVSHL